MKKICFSISAVCLIFLLAACSTTTATRSSSSGYAVSDSLNHSNTNHSNTHPTATPSTTFHQVLSIPSHIATPASTPERHIAAAKVSIPTPTPTLAPQPVHTAPLAPTSPPVTYPSSPSPSPSSNCITFSNETTWVPAANGGLAAPYGPAPVSSEAQTLTQQLFQLINSDRAACGLPAFTWNSTLASGALLHSWNMSHCGLSHYCPDGMSPYQRIANEGYAGAPDCGENIAEAGPYPTPWAGVEAIQESMAHEPLGGWHRIHLFSTTLHQIGIGVYVASNGWIWFTEDMVS
jgi:uncharacterized protein YkwD